MKSVLVYVDVRGKRGFEGIRMATGLSIKNKVKLIIGEKVDISNFPKETVELIDGMKSMGGKVEKGKPNPEDIKNYDFIVIIV